MSGGNDAVQVVVRTKDETAQGMDEVRGRFEGLKKAGAAAGAALGVAGAAAGGLFVKGLADNMNIEASNDRLAAQLNLTGDAADRAGQAAGEVYRDAWGASIDEVNASIKAVGQNIGDISKMSKTELESMSTAALGLAQTFDVDVNASTSAAGSLMKNGLAADSKEAFDIITAGFQNGLDKGGDFIDTLTEYSPQFSKLGISGKGALEILNAGLKAGARNTDVVADAFKEFSLRSIDGSKLTADGFKTLGLNAKDAATAIGKGGESASQMTATVLQRLAAIKDPVKQNAAGVALFGTQWEDTLRQILPAMSDVVGKESEVSGATDKMLKTVGDNGKTRIEGMKRAFEGWVQEMAGAPGALGDAGAAVAAFGGTGLAMAGSLSQVALAFNAVSLSAVKAGVSSTWFAVKTGVVKAATMAWTAAQWLFNVAMSANPIGLIIIAVIALVAAIVIAYKKSDTFRHIVQAACRGAVKAFHWVIDKVSDVISWMRSHWKLVLSIITGPIGAAVIYVATHFGQIRAKASSVVSSIRSTFSRIYHAITSPFQRAINAVMTWLQNLWNRAAGVFNNISGKASSALSWLPGFAHGGVVGQAAAGGVRGSMTWVGEQGPELLDLPPGSRVYSAGDSSRMAAAAGAGGGGGGGPMTVILQIGDRRLGEILIDPLRRAVEARGGNVQVALGRG